MNHLTPTRVLKPGKFVCWRFMYWNHLTPTRVLKLSFNACHCLSWRNHLTPTRVLKQKIHIILVTHKNHLTPSRVLKQLFKMHITINLRTTSHPHGYWNFFWLFSVYACKEPPRTLTGIETNLKYPFVRPFLNHLTPYRVLKLLRCHIMTRKPRTTSHPLGYWNWYSL